jgi:signal transduction histidine kinase
VSAARIWERSYRGSQARRGGGEHGIGLGLALVKMLVEAQDGSITVASEPGRGTTFRVVLPGRARPARAGRPHPTDPPDST